MSRRRKKRGEEGQQDRWMITYADMITLLLTFFIVMYSMSEVQNDKFNAIVQSLQNAFQTKTIESVPEADELGVDVAKESLPAPEKIPQGHSENNESEEQLDQLYQKLQDYIAKNGLDGAISLQNQPRGVQMTFHNNILFDLGQAKIKKEARPVLQKVGGLVEAVDNPIRIEGHTDDQPIIDGEQFASNWELSTARSQSVRRYLQKEDSIKPARMSVVGYGEYQPKAKNDTATHRAQNRRVNLVVLRQGADGAKEDSK